MTKTCTKCLETKPLTEFHKDCTSKDGHAPSCKVCRAAYAVEYRARNRDKLNAYNREYHRTHERKHTRKYILKHLYGITPDQYDEMLEDQGGVCAICGRTPEEHGKRLFVDHDHETDEVRGLLCASCNAGIGMFSDDPALLLAAIDYLQGVIG